MRYILVISGVLNIFLLFLYFKCKAKVLHLKRDLFFIKKAHELWVDDKGNRFPLRRYEND